MRLRGFNFLFDEENLIKISKSIENFVRMNLNEELFRQFRPFSRLKSQFSGLIAYNWMAVGSRSGWHFGNRKFLGNFNYFYNHWTQTGLPTYNEQMKSHVFGILKSFIRENIFTPLIKTNCFDSYLKIYPTWRIHQRSFVANVLLKILLLELHDFFKYRLVFDVPTENFSRFAFNRAHTSIPIPT